MKSRQWVMVLVAALLAISVLVSGCSGNNNNNQGNTSNEGNTGANNVQEEPVDELAKETEEFVALKFYFPRGGEIPKDMAVVQEEINKYLKEKINASLELVPLDWGVWADRSNLIIQSGEQADIMWTANWNNYYNNVAKGGFLALDDYIDKYAPALKDPNNMDPAFLEGKINGKIYGLPTNKEISAPGALFFNKTLADKYNMDFSNFKYVSDLEPYLQTIKENEPGVTPLFGVDLGWFKRKNPAWEQEMEQYADIPGIGFLSLDIKSGKAVSAYSRQSRIDYYNTIRSWFEKGYINKDVLTNKTPTQDAFKAGKGWIHGSTGQPGQLEYWTTQLGPITQVSDNLVIADTNSITGSMIAVNANTEHPERAMMVINLMYSDPTLVNLINFGMEGQHYKTLDDGRIAPPEGAASWEESPYSLDIMWEFGNMFLSKLKDYNPADRFDQLKKMNAETVKSPLLGFVFNPEPVKAEVAALSSAEVEVTSGLDKGVLKVDEALQELDKRLKANGIEKVAAEIEKQYAEWLATKK